MSYGYRLNVEQLLFQKACDIFNKARENFVKVPDSDPITGETYYFYAPDFEDIETITLCIEFILYLAISLESFINLAWQSCQDTSSLPEKDFRTTINKIKYLFKTNSMDYGSFIHRDDLHDLFNLRNKLVHYKTPITYIGFSFAPQYQRDFEKDKMQCYQDSVTEVIRAIGKELNMDIKFLDGHYELIYLTE